MRQHVRKLVGWDSNGEGFPERFYFLDEVFDYGPCGANGQILKGTTGTELVAVIPEHLAWLLTEDGLIWRFSDYEESESQDREWIIAWGRKEIQEQIEADGDPYGRLFDTSYREEYWPQLRAAGFTEEKYPAFDCMGSVWGNTWRDMQHVHDPEAQALALEWEN